MSSYSSPNALGTDGPTTYSYPNNNQQHRDSELPNADDLDLEARLTRGLEPNMSTASPGGVMPDGQDERSHEAIAQQQQQQQHYGQEQGSRTPLLPPAHSPMLQPAHSSMEQMGSQYMPQEDQTAPRKRSKVSRACDECRRKKVKCDASEDGNNEVCTGCKRVGMTCKFSRVPMKRGPSKGYLYPNESADRSELILVSKRYIKELADRLHTLEGHVAANGGENAPANFVGDHLQHRESDEFSPPPNSENTQRKRTFSNLSTDFGPSYQIYRQTGGLTRQENSRQAQAFREPNYHQNGLHPSAQWSKAPETSSQQNSFDASVDLAKSQHNFWNEEVVTTYYTLIHPTFPILHHSKDRLSTGLSLCPSVFREAFHESLFVAAQAFQTSPDQNNAQQSLKRASQLVVALQYENNPSTSTTLVYLQATMLLAIASEILIVRGKAGSSRSFWLSSAVSLSYDFKLHQYRGQDNNVANDVDAEENVSRRIWWILVVMERWHASSVSSPSQIPESSLVVRPEDQQILGDALYHLARLSIILGHISMAHVTTKDIPPLGVPVIQLLEDVLRGEVERWRETLPASLSSSPLVLMCYWHVRIYLELRNAWPDPSELLMAAKHITSCVGQSSFLNRPLVYYPASLAALVLVDLTAFEEGTREVAEEALDSLPAGSVPSAFEGTLREMRNSKRASQFGNTDAMTMIANTGLQQLAAAATDGGNGILTDITLDVPKMGENRTYSSLRDAVQSGFFGVLRGLN
ncbi:hypothetical protein HYFRA_00010207 [Hymenoscyphus fraxineus]|uniref:Zn(2)-C6 fungal-type domain-containing protein n=1 Tax=Hymenoscyphus fraxineus TaxID=746836 RepID=A0A9N9KXT8_9HELO|nr:hypothetical protein HYFRA_00010207 [Hymenoscyphus fraxineus]